MHTLTALLMSITTANATDTAPSADATQLIKELQGQVQRLQRQVDDLTAQSDDNWLTQQRADEIRGLVHDVLADADTRASLLQSGAVAGYDKGFFVGSSDGNFLLRIGGQFQVRYVYNFQDDGGGVTDSNRSGFEMRRAKLIVRGHVLDPSWEYEAQFNADRATGAMTLEDSGWIQKNLENGWKLTFGQMKAPFLREETLSSARMLAVERSLINAQFTAGTVQGLRASWEGDTVRAWGMFHDGQRTANTAWSVLDTEFAVSARAELLAFGAWSTQNDYNSFKDEEDGLIIGGAATYSKGEYGTGGLLAVPEAEVLGITADASWDIGGASLAGAVVYRSVEVDATAISVDQLGILIRGGLFITDNWELYGQYEWGDLDTAAEELSLVTIGATRYWAKHSLKWQTDVGFGLNDIDPAWAADSAGYRPDAPGEDGQIVIRSQFQLLF